jgi:hypothetical protein
VAGEVATSSRLDRGGPASALEDGPGAGQVQAGRLQQQQGKQHQAWKAMWVNTTAR